jgi:hypothetical protein
MTKSTKPLVTFRTTVTTKASPEHVYDVLADLRTHALWAGSKSPNKTFHLLTIDGPPRLATNGDTFTSTGINFNGTFRDRSTVVEAAPAQRFGFDTDATLDRKHGKPWQARFVNRYVIEPSADGALVRATTELFPQNYVPYWFKHPMRGMSRRMAESMTRKNLRGLAVLAESKAGLRVAS